MGSRLNSLRVLKYIQSIGMEKKWECYSKKERGYFPGLATIKKTFLKRILRVFAKKKMN